MKAIWFTILVVIQSHLISCHNILGVFPTHGASHYHVAKALMLGLASAGHNVTIASPFEEKNPPKNYREIKLTKIVGERSMY